MDELRETFSDELLDELFKLTDKIAGQLIDLVFEETFKMKGTQLEGKASTVAAGFALARTLAVFCSASVLTVDGRDQFLKLMLDQLHSTNAAIDAARKTVLELAPSA